ncbi:hypothetical protein [Tsukamurella pseudospumae]|uniref:Uncharacterized protein n=1 Tax=Tsukamurella pseudospumae TaxID=239498 RepID=A0A137ZT46_9ACTN|nr:hypothetical protein [Tsukamurella pseudospumae]KXP01347.1 hypothetical protein AXK61_00565 [Tsukamurella pseudospumae]
MQPHSDPLFGRYTVVAPLGRHATGTSSLVDGPDGRQVLTVLPVADGAAFLRDAAVAARPSGTGAAPVLAYGFADGVAWFVAPDPSGRDLAAVPAADIPVGEMVGRALAALDAASEAGARRTSGVGGGPAPVRRRWPVIAGAVAGVFVLVGAVVGVTVARSGDSGADGPSGPVTAVSGYGDTVCAVADARLYCFGGNRSATNGDGTTTARTAPAIVAGLSRVSDVAVADGVVCAITAGDVYCWGAYSSGLVPEQTTQYTGARTPVKVTGISGATRIAVATSGRLGSTACALTAAGPYCWGSAISSTKPTALRGVPKASAVEVSFVGYAAIACALVDDAVECWTGGTDFDPLTEPPSRVAGLPAVTALSAGGACGVADGRAYCWEGNSATIAAVAAPWASGRRGITAVASDGQYATAHCIVVDGAVSCAGKPTETVAVVSGLDRVTAITTAGPTCAVADGYLYCWGDLAWRTGGTAGGAAAAPVRIEVAR